MTPQHAIIASKIGRFSFQGTGHDRTISRALPRATARELVSELTSAGFEASWAPDCVDDDLAWVYVMADEGETK